MNSVFDHSLEKQFLFILTTSLSSASLRTSMSGSQKSTQYFKGNQLYAKPSKYQYIFKVCHFWVLSLVSMESRQTWKNQNNCLVKTTLKHCRTPNCSWIGSLCNKNISNCSNWLHLNRLTEKERHIKIKFERRKNFEELKRQLIFSSYTTNPRSTETLST